MKTLLVALLAGTAAFGQNQIGAVNWMMPVYGSFNNGTANLILPYTINISPSSQGNFITFTATGSGTIGVVPTSVNPALTSISGYIIANCTTLGYTGKLGFLDNDLNILQSATVSAVAPGTLIATNSESTRDPVSTATGELIRPDLAPDLSLGGPIPIQFRRYYGSLIAANGFTTTMGNNWMHNFEWSLVTSGSYAEVVRPGGKIYLFNQAGTVWQPVTHEILSYQLANGSSGSYQFFDPRTNYIYTFSGAASPYPLTQIQDRAGNSVTITRTSTSAQISDGLGRALTLAYDANGRVGKVTDQTGRTVSFAYTNGNLTQVTDANGKASSFTYTSTSNMSGLMTGEMLPLGNQPVVQTWDASSRVSTQSDASGNTTTFTYGGTANSTISVKDPLGVVTGFTNQIFSDFTNFTDADGQTIAVSYDGSQHRTTLTNRLGGKIARAFSSLSGNMTSETDPLGNATNYTWTAQTAGAFTFYNLTKIQYADGTSWSMTYDNAGHILAIADQAGKNWKYTYNSRGQKLTSVNPAGRALTYAYTASDATLASLTDAAGNATSYSYDPQKRVSQVKFATGDAVQYAYDNLNHVLKTTDERGNTSLTSFNNNERVQATTDGLGKSSSLTYDANERLSGFTDRNGKNTAVAYDKLGQVKSVTIPAGEAFGFTYDTHNRLSAFSDPAGNTTTVAFDKEDVPVSITDALGRKTTLVNDAQGHVVQVMTPLSEKTTLTRDKLGRAVGSVDPTGIASSLTYDSTERIVGYSVGGANGISVAVSRDDSGFPVSLTDPNGSVWKFAYDAGGHLGSRTDPLNRATAYTYDQRNRISSIKNPVASQNFTFDPAGNVVRRVFSDGTDLAFTYDSDNQLLTAPGITLAYDPEGRVTSSNGLAIGRDADGRISSVTYASGKTVTYTYNNVGLLATVTDWAGGSLAFNYDAAHELTAIKRSNGRTTAYTYDADGRITSITDDAGASVALQRDAAGRVISENRTQPQAPLPAPGVNQLTYDAAEQVSGFTYDGKGELSTDMLRTYTWDASARLTSYSGADGAATATYDGFGLRISRTSQGATQNHVWNYATRLPAIAVVRGAAGDQRYYVHAPNGTLLYAIDAASGAHSFYHFDESGSTVMLTGDTGAVTDSYGVTPYGETVTRAGSTDNPFTWMGAFGIMQEGSTNLYYIRSRFYDSSTARFLSPDPLTIVNPLKVNPYQFAVNDPVNHSDFNGFGPEDVVTAPGTIISGGGDLLTKIGDSLQTSADSSLADAAKLVPDTSQALTGNEGVGDLVQTYEQTSSLANKFKAAGKVADAAGKFLDVAKGAIKLNESIKQAQQEYDTNSNATNIGEGGALAALRKLYLQGKLTRDQYYGMVRSIHAATAEQENAQVSALVYDELTAGAVFLEDSLASLGGKSAKAAKVVFDWLGSAIWGTPAPK